MAPLITERTLHPLDETLMHQIPWTFAYAGTSDHRFYDRHWLACVDAEGRGAFISGIAFYKNMGVADGYFCVQQGDQQHNTRFSRPLNEDMQNLRISDFEIRIVEPFKRLEISLAGGTTPLSAELAFEASFAPYCEAHYVDSRGGRIGQEITRYDQSGRWSGWIDLGSGRLDVQDWWGFRDHSWGVRPGVGGFDRSVADPRTKLSATPATPSLSMLHVVMTFELGDRFVTAMCREDAAGNPTYVDGEVITRDGRHTGVRSMEFEVEFHPGTRAHRKVSARIVADDGSEFDVEATPFLHPWAYAGTGYDGGYRDGRGLGAWRGTVVEHDVYQFVAPDGVLMDGRPTPTGHREQFAKMVVNGESITGYCPVMTRGALPKYGLTEEG